MRIIWLLVLLSLQVHARDLNKEYSKEEFQLGKHKISVFIADNDERRGQGLMFIEKLTDTEGMLFIFEEQRPLAFWMKNTLIPLSIGFFDQDGKLVDVQEMKVANSLLALEPPSYKSRSPALYALEMNSEWFAKRGIKPGVRLKLISKPKSQLLKKSLLARH